VVTKSGKEALSLLAVLVCLPVSAQQDWSKIEIRSTKVAEGVFMLEGAGGNLGVATGPTASSSWTISTPARAEDQAAIARLSGTSP
jgi:hypothetical protein